MIAVCLLTCDRLAYTQRTLESFVAHNHPADFALYHADDASGDRRVADLPSDYGFRTIRRSRTRQGWLDMRLSLFEMAAKRSKWILFLENDIETLRPFPWALFAHARLSSPSIYCLRLYGRFKDHGRQQPCLVTHKRRGHVPVEWRPFRGAPEGAQIGQIHWSAQPCVTRREELLALHRDSIEPAGFTVRPKKNVTSHIGLARTAPAQSAIDDSLEAAC